MNTSTATGQLCVTLGPAASVTVGWPRNPADAVALAAGAYELSYDVSSSTPVSLEAKFGEDIAPYSVVNLDVNDMMGSTLQTFLHEFSLTAADPGGGLAFNFALNENATGTTTVCFDNVLLVAMDNTTD